MRFNEIKKGQKDANGFTRCWPGKHAEGTKKGKNGGQVRACVPNESVAEVQLTPLWQDNPEHLEYRKKQANISRNTGLAVGDLVTLKDRPGFKGKIVRDWGGGDFTISGNGGGMSQSNNHRANARNIQKLQGVAEEKWADNVTSRRGPRLGASPVIGNDSDINVYGNRQGYYAWVPGSKVLNLAPDHHAFMSISSDNPKFPQWIEQLGMTKMDFSQLPEKDKRMIRNTLLKTKPKATTGPAGYLPEQGVAEGWAKGEYGRVLDALQLYYPRLGMTELNVPGYHKVIADKANVPMEYAARVINDFARENDPDEDEFSDFNDDEQGVAEDYNAEYDDEAGMADNNLSTLRRAVEGLDDLIDSGDNLPEWCQEKIAVAKSMLVSVWDYMESNDDAEEEFDLIESIIDRIAGQNGVDAEMVWEDLESLSHDELYAFAVTSQLNEDWSKVNKRDKTDGMSQKAVNAYRRENPGSKLKTAVTTKPSKLKKGSKASKRRKSYCSRSKGQMNMHNISCAKTPDKAICKARRRWNC